MLCNHTLWFLRSLLRSLLTIPQFLAHDPSDPCSVFIPISSILAAYYQKPRRGFQVCSRPLPLHLSATLCLPLISFPPSRISLPPFPFLSSPLLSSPLLSTPPPPSDLPSSLSTPLHSTTTAGSPYLPLLSTPPPLPDLDKAQKLVFIAAHSKLERRDFSYDEVKDAELFSLANGEDDVLNEAAALKVQETNVITDNILKVLGLEVCADTMVGDQMRRGISGGQRKRLTTGEMRVGPARALFQSFHIGQELGDELARDFDKSRGNLASLATEKYGVSKKELILYGVSN